MTIRDMRQRNAADKAAGQCRGDIGVYIDGSRLIVDVAVADATYRTLIIPHPHQMSPRIPSRTNPTPEAPLRGRVNDDDAGTEKTWTPNSPVSPANRLP